MGAFAEKVMGLFGASQEPDIDEEEYEEYEEADEAVESDEPVEERKIWGGLGRNKVVSMPQVQPIKMVISQPTNFDQAATICELLKQKKSIVVNLEYVNKDVARRIIDVTSGAVHALDAHMEKVSNSIVLIAPVNYEIENEMARDEIKNKLSVSWLRNGNQQ